MLFTHLPLQSPQKYSIPKALAVMPILLMDSYKEKENDSPVCFAPHSRPLQISATPAAAGPVHSAGQLLSAVLPILCD